ncbi:hypothetical protein E143388_06980 [Rhodococcus opacus]|nr:hypothetical protein E143388_06980 [Rhodococcus opacus]
MPRQELLRTAPRMLRARIAGPTTNVYAAEFLHRSRWRVQRPDMYAGLSRTQGEAASRTVVVGAASVGPVDLGWWRACRFRRVVNSRTAQHVTGTHGHGHLTLACHRPTPCCREDVVHLGAGVGEKDGGRGRWVVPSFPPTTPGPRRSICAKPRVPGGRRRTRRRIRRAVRFVTASRSDRTAPNDRGVCRPSGYPRTAVVCGYPLSTLPAPRRRTGHPAPLRPPNPFGRRGAPSRATEVECSPTPTSAARGPDRRNVVDHANIREAHAPNLTSPPFPKSIAQQHYGRLLIFIM